MKYIFWVLTLLFTLIGAASAFPLLPAEFSGTVAINDNPAPAGTVIIAQIDGHDRGSPTLTEAGSFGGTSTFDKRLLVSGEDGDAGKTITFLVDGLSTGTAVHTTGTSTNLALAVAKDDTPNGGSGETPSTSTSTGSSTSSSGGSPTGPITTPAPVTKFTGSAPLTTDASGKVQSAAVVTTTEGDTSLSISQGVLARDRSGRPLDTVNVESIPPATLPGTTEPAGRAVRCGPAGATFDPAIRISFALTPEEWEHADAGEFVVRWYNNTTGSWESLPTTVYPTSHTVTAAVSHFTLMAVFVVPAEETPPVTVTAPTLTFGPVAQATAVRRVGSPFPWLAGLAVLVVGVILWRR